MLNPVANAVKEIMFTIPKQILSIAFREERFGQWRRVAPVSIDEMIKSKVIYARVLKDMNFIGGRHAYINTEGIPFYEQDTYSLVFEIPMQRTGNREIISVLAVNYMPHSSGLGGLGTPYGNVNPSTQSDAESTGQRVMDAVANVPHLSAAHAELIGFNTVVIRDQSRSTTCYEMRCMLANEENLSNISPRSYSAVADAAKLACQSYIYNEMIIRMDQGILEQGQALGEFKNQIDKYSDSEEKYQEYLKTKLQKILFMNDTISYDRFIQAQVNPAL